MIKYGKDLIITPLTCLFNKSHGEFPIGLELAAVHPKTQKRNDTKSLQLPPNFSDFKYLKNSGASGTKPSPTTPSST